VKTHSYLNFAGNAEEAFNFYKSVFGGEFSSVVRFKDFPMEGVEIPEADEDKVFRWSGLPPGQSPALTTQRSADSPDTAARPTSFHRHPDRDPQGYESRSAEAGWNPYQQSSSSRPELVDGPAAVHRYPP
jgi:hypothetical protein